MKIALYVRVSTHNGRQDTDNQLAPLRDWAKRLGGEIVGEYIDEASGSKADRKALKQLLDDAHLRKYDTLLIWALDRLSREGIARMSGYIERLQQSGIRVLSHQEPWLDTSGPISELITAIFAWVGQFERQRIRERIMAGLERAKGQGKRLGRPRKVIDLDKLQALRQQGRTIREMAQHLGVPRTTLSDYLSGNPHPNEGC